MGKGRVRVWSRQITTITPPAQGNAVAPNRSAPRKRKMFLLRGADVFGFFVRLDATHDQAGIGTAKTEAIGQSDINRTLLSRVCYSVNHALA